MLLGSYSIAWGPVTRTAGLLYAGLIGSSTHQLKGHMSFLAMDHVVFA